MGNLLRILYCRDYEDHSQTDIFVDFENAVPTTAEQEVWTKVQEVLLEANVILEELAAYEGAAAEIREAISNPQDATLQQKAWSTVLPLVLKLNRYFAYSNRLESTVPTLLALLCSNDMSPRKHLESQQASFKQFAHILDFTLKFDDLKMTNPAIQNDFSYYRRTMSRMKMNGVQDLENNLDVNESVANRMSLFYANATPMLKVLGETTSKFVSENKNLPIENTTDCLCTMASICRVMIDNTEYRTKIQNETVMFCLRVMVGVIILYDHVHPIGAFVKSSNIDIKNSIKVLREHAPQKVESLMNALRYTTKHLNDDSTPKAVKALLGV